jgi:hypothetical protein
VSRRRGTADPRGAPDRGRAVSACAFVVAALVAGWGAGRIVDDSLQWNALAGVVPIAVLVALFGWWRRDRDVVDVFAGGWLVAYAGFLGLAAARVPRLPSVGMQGWGLDSVLRPSQLGDQWPVVLLGGVAFALIATVAVALPASALPRRHPRDANPPAREANDALWRFVEQHIAQPPAAHKT